MTRRRINEQIQIAYGQFLNKNGFNDNIDVRVIDIYVQQAINKNLKVQSSENIKFGNYELPSSTILTYTVSVTSNKAELPIIPVNLPYDIGVWSVRQGATQYIPIPQMYESVYGGTLVSNLEGQTGYRIKGNVISFSKPTTGTVDIEVLVADYDEIGETDLLPITPDMEIQIVAEVLEILSSGRVGQLELQSKDTKTNAN